MPGFQHLLWGYELTYPVDWVHRSIADTEGFASIPEAFEAGYEGPNAGQLLVRAEWNGARQPVEPLWNNHIGMMAGMMGAKDVGSAPWMIGGATGFEAEIKLPQKENRRLWAGILEREFIVLHFMVTHPHQERSWFEPAVTKVISSLSFATHTQGVHLIPEGLPLPPGYVTIDPVTVLPDIANPGAWRAFDGADQIGALQAFYWREAPNYGWQLLEFIPFPSSVSDLGFARISLSKEGRSAILGLMPFGEENLTSASPARIVVKYG
jgi:hypothetical protein